MLKVKSRQYKALQAIYPSKPIGKKPQVSDVRSLSRKTYMQSVFTGVPEALQYPEEQSRFAL